MSEQFRLEYELHDAGWATATVSFGRRSVPMVVSYLHDSLRQLASAIDSLDMKAREASVVFMDEPGEHHLILTRTAADAIAVEVVWYADWRSWKMYDGPGESRLQGKVRFADLRARVVALLAELLARHGRRGYRKKWVEHPFPMAEYERLAGQTEAKGEARRRRR